MNNGGGTGNCFEKAVIYAPFVIVLLFTILVMVQADKKFVLDEIDFPIVSRATSETGTPVYYRGEENPRAIGIYHPTLYIHAQALFIRIFGYNENVIRAFGMLCALLTAFFSILIVRLLYLGDARNRYFDSIFLILFLLHPYTIANATLPDIDPTVLPLVITVFFYFFIKRFGDSGIKMAKAGTHAPSIGTKWAVFITGLLFALCLWTKLTTPAIMPLFMLLLLLSMGYRPVKSLSIAVAVTLLGVIIFLSTYWIYCFALDLPFVFTFKFLLQSFAKGTTAAGVSERLQRIIHNFNFFKVFINWLTLPFFVLVLTGFFYTFGRLSNRPSRAVFIMSLFGFLVMAAYSGLITPFGGFFKYPFAGFNFLMMPAALMAVEVVNWSKGRNIMIPPLGILAVAVLENRFLGDSLIRHRAEVSFLLIFALVLLSILLAVAISAFKTKRYASWAIILLLMITGGYELGLSRAQAIAPYPTKYYYGQTGLEETITYLKANTKRDEVIWAMKDVGYYVNNRYEESYGYFFFPELQDKLVRLMREGNIRYYVATRGVGEDNVAAYPQIEKILTTYGKVEKTFGDFVIFSVGK